MNKIFDENKIATFRDLKDLTTSNKLVGRREIIIGIDERAIEELRNYVYKANMYDEKDKEIKRYKKFVDDILNFYKHNRYEEELTKDNMFKLVLNQNEMIMTIEEFKGGK